MTTIRLGVLHPTGTATDERSTGSVEWVPSARRVVGADVILPDAFRVALSADADVTVAVAPTTTAWVWKVLERVSGGSGGWRYLAVPDSAEVVDYAALVEVDPATLDPITTAPTIAAELALKAPSASPAFTGTPTGITRAHVGLGSVDDTADVDKPVSDAQGEALAAKLDATVASSTYAAVGFIRPLPRVVVIGCSIENLYSYRTVTGTSASEQYGRDWPTFAMLLSSGRFQLLHNMGNGGENTGQYLARYDADVTPSAPETVVIGGAENDIQQAVSIATIKANIVALVAKTRAIGAVPVLRTTMPHGVSNAVRKSIGAVNHWTRNYGVQNGIVVLDFWRQLVNPTNGQYLAAYSADGVHPNEAGHRLLGQYVVDTLCATIPATSLSLAADPTDAGQLLPTPLFLTDSSGTPTTWNALGGTPAGVTRSMVTDALVPGRMARLALVAGPSVSIANNSSVPGTTGVTAGDVLEVSGVFTSDGGVSATINIAINYNDGTVKNIGRVPVSAITAALTRATYCLRLPAVPAVFISVLVTLTAGAGTGVVDFGYPTVRNLTREGIL